MHYIVRKFTVSARTWATALAVMGYSSNSNYPHGSC